MSAHFPIRVYYEDTDAAGWAYHAAYLKMADRARTELLWQAGIRHGADQGPLFVVRRVEIDYLSPARLSEALVVTTRTKARGRASMTLGQSITRDGQELARLTVVLVCVDGGGKPVRPPAAVTEFFDRMAGPEAVA